MVHVLPEKIAEKRHHPQQTAIKTLCLLSLVFGGMLWPIAWLWAYTKPIGYKLAYGTDKHENYFKRGGRTGRSGQTAARLNWQAIREELDELAARGQLTPELRAVRDRLAALHVVEPATARAAATIGTAATTRAAESAGRSRLMEALLLGIYSFFVWLIFIKFKWLPWNTTSQVIVAIIPIVGLTALILLLNVFAPSSADVRVIKYVVQIMPQVKGRVIEVPVEGNKLYKKGEVLFRIDPTPYELDVKSLQAQLSEAEGQANQLREQLKSTAGNTGAVKAQRESGATARRAEPRTGEHRRRQPVRSGQGPGRSRESGRAGDDGAGQRGAGARAIGGDRRRRSGRRWPSSRPISPSRAGNWSRPRCMRRPMAM